MVENLEKALAQAFAYKEKYVSYSQPYNITLQPKETVICDILIAKFMNIIKQKSVEILDIYNDEDGLFREENDIFSGTKFASDVQH